MGLDLAPGPLTSSLHGLVEPALGVQLRVPRLGVLQLDRHLLARAQVDGWGMINQLRHRYCYTTFDS